MQISVRAQTAASPADVYSVLADIGTHREWAGDRQLGVFRLIDIRPSRSGAASVGDTWTSTGKIPVHHRRWEDCSRVTVAEPGRAFEYVTEARIAGTGTRAGREAAYRHRFDLTEQGGRTRITYTLTELRSIHPLLRLAVPGVRAVVWATGVRLMAWRGVRNVTRMADADGSESSVRTTAATA